MRKTVLLSVVLLLSSCAVQQEEPERSKIRELESRLADIESRQDKFEEQLVKTNERIDKLSQILSDVRVDMENVKLEQERLKKMSEGGVLEVVGERDRDKEHHEKEVVEKPKPKAEVVDKKETSQEQVATEPMDMHNFEEAYRKAHELYTLKRLYEARDRFLSFIKNYKPNKYTDNAYFWVGKIFHELGDLEKAEAVYKSLIKKCEAKRLPDCNKAPSAYLMLARIYEERGNYEEAKRYYDALVEKYPMSEEAFKIKELRGE